MVRPPAGSWLCWCAGLTLAACVGQPPPPPAGEGSSTGASTDASTGLGMTSTPTPTTMTTDEADSGSSTSGRPGTSTASESSSSEGSSCVNAALGEPCEDPVCDCASDNCFVVGPLGGVCSECDESADCEATTGFGCNFGNPLNGTPAVCSQTGAVGESCETIDHCAGGLYCPTLIEVAGILSTATCSACDPETSSGCLNGEICAPTYDIATIGGYYHCVAPGSVPNAQGCNLTGDGSECASGQCAPAGLQGIPVIAVCSPCNEDGDCGAGLSCRLPEIVIDDATMSLALMPGACT